jgi:hypothetical protein
VADAETVVVAAAAKSALTELVVGEADAVVPLLLLAIRC